jgi:hypothetical protein
VALAVPLLYGAWLLGFTLRIAPLGRFYDYLPALGLLFGCVLLLGGWNAHWAWGVVAASGLWTVSLLVYDYTRLLTGHGPHWVYRFYYAQTAIGIYAFILALAFILNRPTDAKDRAAVLEP